MGRRAGFKKMLLMKKGFISTGMYFFVYVLLVYTVYTVYLYTLYIHLYTLYTYIPMFSMYIPMFSSLSFQKKEKHTLVALYVMCVFVNPSQNLERS